MKQLTLISLIVFSCLLTSCTTVVKDNYIDNTPVVIDRPEPPKLSKLDPNQSLSSQYNFRILATNLSLLQSYIQELVATINYYETSITSVQKNISE